jgi:hypothetical protein
LLVRAKAQQFILTIFPGINGGVKKAASEMDVLGMLSLSILQGVFNYTYALVNNED